jgi:hypothetical protein
MIGGNTTGPELEEFWCTDSGLTAADRAAAYGIDLSLIDENLRLTPAERMEKNEEALALMRSLEKHLECDAGA